MALGLSINLQLIEEAYPQVAPLDGYLHYIRGSYLKCLGRRLQTSNFKRKLLGDCIFQIN